MPSGGFFVIMIYYNATGHPLQKVIINSQIHELRQPSVQPLNSAASSYRGK